MEGTGKFRARNTARARELRQAATPAERLLWTYLARSQLGAKFSRQMPVEAFFADFLCRERKLIIELEGHSHDVQPQRDVYRDHKLKETGYRVLHFTNSEVLGNVAGVISSIQLALQEVPTPNPSRRREGSR